MTSLKAKLSERLSEVRDGGVSFVVTDRNVPIARLVPIGSEDDQIVEREASGDFRPVKPDQAASVKLDWAALLAAERGDR